KICLDTYIRIDVYIGHGICLRNYCRAESPRHPQPPRFFRAIRRRNRAPPSHVAAQRLQAPARSARCRFRGVHRGRSTTPLPPETRTVSGTRLLARAVPPVLVRASRRSRALPRSNGSTCRPSKVVEGIHKFQIESQKRRNKMKIKVTTVYVDDQDRALHFYTEVLGFVKKTDFSQGPFRWLTVASSEEPNGTELQLALNNNPVAKAFQQGMFQQNQAAAMFFTDNLQADYDRMKAGGATFTMPPTDVTASIITMVNDTCGNLIQLTQLKQWKG